MIQEITNGITSIASSRKIAAPVSPMAHQRASGRDILRLHEPEQRAAEIDAFARTNNRTGRAS